MKPYKPQKKTRIILARALELVNSVPYQVSLRWLFYRLLQEGFYSSKDDYRNKFEGVISDARHGFYGGWRPDTLADDTREAVVRGDGFDSVEDWLDAVRRAECKLDKWTRQDNYVELWFEARAMRQQFAFYTEHVTLRPLGGQPSIPYKWEAAKVLEEAAERYQRPIVVVYFGDLDTAGENIAQTVERDVRKWCAADFQFIHGGLTAEQVRLYGVPENPEKPGDFQWEALTDDAARDIITRTTSRFYRQDGFLEAGRQEQRATAWLRDELVAVVGKWQSAPGW